MTHMAHNGKLYDGKMLTVEIEFRKHEDESLALAAKRLDGHNNLRLIGIKDMGDGTFWARMEFKSAYEMKLTIAELFGLVEVGETDTAKVASALAMAGEYFTEEDDSNRTVDP